MQESLLSPPPVSSAPSSRPGPSRPEPKAERPELKAERIEAKVERLEQVPEPRVPAGSADLAEAWSRVVNEIMSKKALLGSVLQHTTPLAVADGVLTIALGGNHFHKEQLTNQANRELINQTLSQHVSGARRFELGATGSEGGGARNHPAVQAALSVFPGEVVAVRPRVPEEGATP